MCELFLYSASQYDIDAFTAHGQPVLAARDRLTISTAYKAEHHEAVSCFVNDDLSRPVLQRLYNQGTRYVLLRCAGFDRVDLDAAREIGIKVARVPAYSPESIAEHALALTLTLARRIPQSIIRQDVGSYTLDGLVGFTLKGKKVGIIGGGKIGQLTANLYRAFGCAVDIYDPFLAESVSLDEALDSDIVSLHCPLNSDTLHLIDEKTIRRMREGALLINTARGGLVRTEDLLEDLEVHHHLMGYAADVVEGEDEVFFRPNPHVPMRVRRLRKHPNVVLTGHQAFLTWEALDQIAVVCIENLKTLKAGGITDGTLS